jgi:hypothetical protein
VGWWAFGAALVISLFQAFAFIFLGIANLLFGNATEKLTTVVSNLCACVCVPARVTCDARGHGSASKCASGSTLPSTSSRYLTSIILLQVQAGMASGYTDLIDSLMSITPETIGNVFEKFVFFGTGTITMAFATLKSAKGRQILKGTTTGFMIADPFLKTLNGILFTSVAGCKSLGEPTTDFPKGKPSDCMSNEVQHPSFVFRERYMLNV